ncbi:MAG: type II toxin-antitoxin system death-on-curing family toxin, partial [Lewinella sp.]
MRYLTKYEILRLNQLTVSCHGGHFVPPDNLLHLEAIEYLVESVSADMYGEPLYPEVCDKAAVYLFNIISNHAFQDGNKRTVLAAALAFLTMNSYRLSDELSPVNADGKLIPKEGKDHNDNLYRFTMAVAAGEVSLHVCRQWF